jgi:hypothetical protein
VIAIRWIAAFIRLPRVRAMRRCSAIIFGGTPHHHLTADLIDRDERMRPLVDIGSNNNHGGCLLHFDQ